MSKRSLTAQYNAMLRLIARHSRKRDYGKWARVSGRAMKLRERMIALNRSHAPAAMSSRPMARMSPASARLYRQAHQSKEGKAVAGRFKRFWKIPGPPKIDLKDGPGGSKKIWLVGMGTTPVVFLSTGQKGQRGKKISIRGQWLVNTDGSGRHVVLLSSRKMSGPLKHVGFAPQTHYVPPKDVEEAGTHKRNTYWIHRHGVNDQERNVKRLVWPAVFADRNGTVDKDSNFVYAKNHLMRVDDWMYG